MAEQHNLITGARVNGPVVQAGAIERWRSMSLATGRDGRRAGMATTVQCQRGQVGGHP
jgi:hypothetical protein